MSGDHSGMPKTGQGVMLCLCFLYTTSDSQVDYRLTEHGGHDLYIVFSSQYMTGTGSVHTCTIAVTVLSILVNFTWDMNCTNTE